MDDVIGELQDLLIKLQFRIDEEAGQVFPYCDYITNEFRVIINQLASLENDSENNIY